MSKRLLLIIGVLVIVVGVGYFVWAQNSAPAGEEGTGGFSFKNFFPFGNSEEAANELEDTGTSEEVGSTGNNNGNSQPFTTISPLAKLRKLSAAPTAGALLTNTGTTTVVRFIEKATGNIYEARSDSQTVRRLTNTTIPKISRAWWLATDSLLVQTVTEDDLLETSHLRLRPSTATSSETAAPFQVTISKLPTGIQELSVSPDGKKIVYYTRENGSTWYTSNPDGTGRLNIYKSPITGWVPQWYSANSILLTTKASYLASTYGYTLRSTGGRPSKVFGGDMGASAKMNQSGSRMLLAGGEGYILTLLDTATGGRTSIDSPTLPEKCAWDPSDANYVVCGIPRSISGNYPDDWYKGMRATNDLIERINVTDNVVFIASDPEKEVDTQIDVKEMYLSKDGRYAAFLHKGDSSLWLLKLKE